MKTLYYRIAPEPEPAVPGTLTLYISDDKEALNKKKLDDTDYHEFAVMSFIPGKRKVRFLPLPMWDTQQKYISTKNDLPKMWDIDDATEDLY